MKFAIFFAFSLLATSAIACPDLTGYYKSDRPRNRALITHITQLNCDQITLGYIVLENGKITDDLDPAITYYNSNNCGSKCYLRFEEATNLMRLIYRGSIEIPGDGLVEKYQCHYDYVEYSITSKGDLLLSHPIISRWDGDPCGKVGTYTELHIKTEKP